MSHRVQLPIIKSASSIPAGSALASGFESTKSAIDQHFSEHLSGLRKVVGAYILVNLIMQQA